MPRHPSSLNRAAATVPERRRRLLILGPIQQIPEILGEAIGASALLARVSDLDAGLLARAEPDAVLTRLPDSDAAFADLVGLLFDLGYRGILRCYGGPMPRQPDIGADLTTAFPGLAVEIVALPR